MCTVRRGRFEGRAVSSNPAPTTPGVPEMVRSALGLDDDVIGVNAGSWGPLCRAAHAAIQEAYAQDRARRPGPHTEYMAEFYERLADRDRDEVAGLINCAPHEVALCESTGAAMNIFLWGCDLEPGD